MNRFGVCFVSFLVLAASAQADSIQLIVNGGFETGDLTGWTVRSEANSFGGFSVISGDAAPLSELPTPGPASGTYYAVADQTGPTAAVLSQSFTVAPGAASVILSFDMFTNNYEGSVTTGALDYTQGVQFATADLLTGTANAFSTAPSDVLENFFQGGASAVIESGVPNPYIAYSFDITSLVSGGGTYQLRFGDADDQFYLTTGVDNVSVMETLSPEPSTFLLFLPAIGALAAWKRRVGNPKQF